MTKINTNDLKKLSRKELLELLIDQVEENQRLKEEINLAMKELDKRDLIISNAGSLAEASLEIFEVFQRADQAAKLYLENVKKLADKGENHG